MQTIFTTGRQLTMAALRSAQREDTVIAKILPHVPGAGGRPNCNSDELGEDSSLSPTQKHYVNEYVKQLSGNRLRMSEGALFFAKTAVPFLDPGEELRQGPELLVPCVPARLIPSVLDSLHSGRGGSLAK